MFAFLELKLPHWHLKTLIVTFTFKILITTYDNDNGNYNNVDDGNDGGSSGCGSSGSNRSNDDDGDDDKTS